MTMMNLSKAAVRRQRHAAERLLSSVTSIALLKETTNSSSPLPMVGMAAAATASAVLLLASRTNEKEEEKKQRSNILCHISPFQQQQHRPQSQSQQNTTQLPPPKFRIEDVYEIQHVLGEGSFGKVYQAIRRQDQKQVALKQIRRHPIIKNGDELLLFQHEIDVMTILSSSNASAADGSKHHHHHICQLYDQHQDSNNYYVVMELCGESDLFEYLYANGSMSENTTARYMEQLLDAVQHIHSKNLIHGDLKLENIMIDPPTETLKIVDFGNAVSSTSTSNDEHDNSSSSSSPTTCGTSGTLAYMPPEMHQYVEEGGRIRNKNPRPTTAVDMYALGVIMYICLTGEHPFDPTGDATDEEIVMNIIDSNKQSTYLQEVVFATDRTVFLSSMAIDLLQRLLHPDPKERMTLDQFQTHPWMKNNNKVLLSGSDGEQQRCVSSLSPANGDKVEMKKAGAKGIAGSTPNNDYDGSFQQGYAVMMASMSS